MVMAADGRGPWPQARTMATTADGHGMSTTAAMSMATDTDAAYQEEGEEEEHRSKRKEKRSRRKEAEGKKETYVPRTSVGRASHGARADATRDGGSCDARVDVDKAGARVDTVVIVYVVVMPMAASPERSWLLT